MISRTRYSNILRQRPVVVHDFPCTVSRLHGRVAHARELDLVDEGTIHRRRVEHGVDTNRTSTLLGRMYPYFIASTLFCSRTSIEVLTCCSGTWEAPRSRSVRTAFHEDVAVVLHVPSSGAFT
jgi:hypothetical protein